MITTAAQFAQAVYEFELSQAPAEVQAKVKVDALRKKFQAKASTQDVMADATAEAHMNMLTELFF